MAERPAKVIWACLEHAHWFLKDCAMEMKHIPLDQIVRNPDQPRKRFDQDELEDLAATIKVVGVGQPILVKPYGDRYMLMAGERRWRASGLAQLETIPALIRSDLRGGGEALMRLIENEQRSDLTTMEKARYIQILKEEEGLTQEEIALALGKKTNRPKVAHYLSLLALPDEVQQMLDDGRLEMGHGKVLGSVAQEYQAEVARESVKQSWTVRQLEAYVKRSNKKKPKQDNSKEVADALARMETGASETVGYPVKIQHSSRKNSGKVMIEYSSLAELDGIMECMGYKGDS